MMERVMELREIVRIEGHLDVEVVLADDKVLTVKAMAKEGTRVIERILLGRNYYEVPEITSRLCGVCSVIHKTAAVQAMENALSIEIPPDIHAVRELANYGGHMQSHILHLFFFVMPDQEKISNVFDLLPSKKDEVIKLVKMKKLANQIIERTGGSIVHPVGIIVGGLGKKPSKANINAIKEILRELRLMVLDSIKRFLEIKPIELYPNNVYLALKDGAGIPILKGHGESTDGVKFFDIDYQNFINLVKEDYSTAPHWVLKDNKIYTVGAISRLNINYHNLGENARELCKKFNIKFPINSPYANNLAQAIELVQLLDQAEEKIEFLQENGIKEARVKFKVRDGEGVTLVEAPRGFLIHHYKVNENGKVTGANIITPTAQNLKSIEINAKYLLERYREEISNPEHEIEVLVRAYDPCISCSARFFKA